MLERSVEAQGSSLTPVCELGTSQQLPVWVVAQLVALNSTGVKWGVGLGSAKSQGHQGGEFGHDRQEIPGSGATTLNR